MNDEKDWESEQREEHKITWWIIRMTEKLNEMKDTK